MQTRRLLHATSLRRFSLRPLLSIPAAGLLTAALLGASAFPSRAQTAATWNGGTGNWSDGGLWTPGGTPNSASADVFLDGGKTGVASVVNVDGVFTVGRLTVDAGDRLNINNSQSLTVTSAGGFAGSGSLTNNGNLVVNSAGSYTDLLFNGTTRLSGTGTLTLQNAARVRGSGTLTNSSTLQGETSNGGSLGTNELGLVNAAGGLINANVAGLALVVDPNSANGLSNQGTLRASGGGLLVLTGNGGGTFANSNGGVIEALAGSQVQLSDGAVVSGGTLSTVGSGTVRTINSATLTNVTNAGAFVINNGTGTTVTGTLTNNGTLTLNSTGSYTDVLVSGNVTLAGTGTLNLQNAARIRGSGTLTNTSTLQGETSNSGSLGADEIGLINQSLINANVAGLALVLDPNNASGLTNNGGTLRASAGGILQLSGNGGGTFNNAGGTIEALNNAAAASEVQLRDGAAITGGTLNSTGNGVVRATGGGSSLTTLTNAGRLVVDNGANVTLAGTLTNNGTLTLNSTGSYTDVLVSGNVTLAGTGTLNLQNAARVRGSGTLTNNSTLQGETSNSGSIGANEIGVVNAAGGLINANVAGSALVLDPSQTGNLVNQGTLRASAGGVLLLTGNSGGTFNNSGTGVIEALAGSEVQLTGGAALAGGTLSTVGSGVVRNLDNATLGTLTNAGTFVANNSTTTSLAAGSTLTNNGSFTVNSTGSYTDLLLNGGATLIGTGTLTLQNAARVGGSGTLTNRSTIQGETSNSGSLGSGQINLVNQGLILANAGNRLNIDPASSFNNVAGGIVRATTGGLALFSGPNGAVTNNGVFAASGNNAVVSVPAATLSNYSNGTLTGGTYTANGTSASTPATVDLTGAAVTTNAATVKLIGAGASLPAINSMATNRGTFALDGSRTFTTAGALAQPAGALAVAGGSRLTVNGVFTQSGGSVYGAGTVAATSQTISGNLGPGSFALNELASGLSEFDPANHAAGSLTLQGNGIVLTAQASLTLSLGAPAGPGSVGANNDHLFVSGAFTLDGTLSINPRAGFGPGTYDLIDYAGGTFTNNVLELGTVPAGYNYQIVTTVPGQVDLVVSVAPEPSTWAALLAGGGWLAAAYRRRSRRQVG